MRLGVQELGLDVWEAGMEWAEEIGRERLGHQKRRKACFEQA